MISKSIPWRFRKIITTNSSKTDEALPSQPDRNMQENSTVKVHGSIICSRYRNSSNSAFSDLPPFAPIFNNLPQELRIQVLCQMSLSDVLCMRLVCRKFRDFVDSSQSSIVRHFTEVRPLEQIASLYQPVTSLAPRTFQNLFGLSRRYHVVKNLSDFLANRLVANIHRLSSWDLHERPDLMLELVSQKMALKVEPYLLMLFHFLETYRAELARLVRSDDIFSNATKEDINRNAEASAVRQYNGHIVHNLSALCHFLIVTIMMRLRPASYAGFLERTLRGWSGEPASEAQCVELLVLGGLESVYRVLSISNYVERVAAMRQHLRNLTSERLDPQLARRFSVIPRKHRIADHDGEIPAIMPPLDKQTAAKIRQVLPGSRDFLQIARLASLFDPGVVQATPMQYPWDFAKSLMMDDNDVDFSLVAESSRPTY